MRILTLVIALLLAGCSGGPERPVVNITSARWAGDQVTVEVKANLPDGAILSWRLVDAAEDERDPEDVNGFADVTDNTAVFAADVTALASDEAQLRVSFAPAYHRQPEHVQDTYGSDQMAEVETTVRRG